MIRGTRLAAPVLFLVVLLAGAGLAMRATAETPPAAIGPLTIDVPVEVTAGTSLPLTVRAIAPDGTGVTLTLVGGYGPLVFRGEFQDGVAQFPIAVADTSIAGVVSAVARAGNQTASREFSILPGSPIEPVKPLVGARTIVADGEHWSMTVAIPFDAFGNPVADGTIVTIEARHPNGDLTSDDRPVTHMVAWTRIYSGTLAGRTVISTRAGDAVGPEGIVDEVAGWPVPFDLTVEPVSVPADGRSQVMLRTTELRDVYGNVLPDGTLVTFIATGLEGEHRIPSVSVGGYAEAPLRSPTLPQTVDVRAIVFDVESREVVVRFTDGPAVGSFPVSTIVLEQAGKLVIDIGPTTGSLGQYVPDGTVVTAEITHGEGTPLRVEGTVSSGHAVLEVRLVDLVPGLNTITVTAGSGSGSTTVEIPVVAPATPVASPVAGVEAAD